jgi:hypothetical protein
MTVTEARAERAIATGIPRCSVMVAVSDLLDATAFFAPVGLVLCGLPAVGYWQGKCPCGHVRDGWMCEVHAEGPGDGGCLACLEVPGDSHKCPLPLSRVTPGGAS